MFCKDRHGIQVCQFGVGDVAVGEATFSKISTKIAIAVVFGEIKKGKIGREVPGYKDKRDFEANVKLKFIFTNPKSIDVVIKELQQAKELMIGKKEEL